MSKKMDSLMEQVAQVATERKELEVKEQALKEALLEEMRSAGLTKEKKEYGSFTIKPYTKWIYSDKLVAKKSKIKEEEINEQRQGIATAEITESLTFTAVKVN
jgi:hypothetical protein